MHRHDTQTLSFVQSFVDAVTVRPFFDDLKELRRVSRVLRPLAAQLEQSVYEPETANAA